MPDLFQRGAVAFTAQSNDMCCQTLSSSPRDGFMLFCPFGEGNAVAIDDNNWAWRENTTSQSNNIIALYVCSTGWSNLIANITLFYILGINQFFIFCCLIFS